MDAQELVEDFLEREGRRDVDGLRPLLSEDFVWEQPLATADGQARLEGRDAFCAHLSKYFGPGGWFSAWAFTDIRTYPGDGDGLVFAEWRSSGTVAANGAAYENRHIALFRVRDGRIAHFRVYADPHRVRAALAAKG